MLFILSHELPKVTAYHHNDLTVTITTFMVFCLNKGEIGRLTHCASIDRITHQLIALRINRLNYASIV
jgi:hypothetical protein